MPQIKADSVAVRFEPGRAVIEDLNFSIAGGEFVSIVGPSGCGKTTLLRLVAGLAAPSSGQLITHEAPRSAFVFQEPNLLPWRNVAGNIRLPLELRRASFDEQNEAVQSSLRLIGLSNADCYKRPGMLSGGMKMRVSLARSLVTEPDILLLDEPFAALDDMLRQRLNEELLNIWLRQNWTALFVTHNVVEAVFLSQRILVMDGKPGTVAETIDVPFSYPRLPELRADVKFTQLALRVSRQLRGER